MGSSLKVSSMYSDHMILQQNARIPVWGEASDDQIICVDLAGQRVFGKPVNGKWKIVLQPLNFGGPYEMTVSNGKESISFHNVLIGEVWLAGGQSNMEQPLKFTDGGRDEALKAEYSQIRFYITPRRPYEGAVIEGYHFIQTISEDQTWQICTPKTAENLSAVAYYFARDLHKTLKVPIGIICCNWGGTSAQVWMNEEYLRQDAELNEILEEYHAILNTLDMNQYENQWAEYQSKLHECCMEKDEDKNPEYPVPIPSMGPKCFYRPCGLYHTMLEKVVPYAIQGVIWYQGESNAEKYSTYKKLFTTLIKNWRDVWENENLPFLFVQLAPFVGWYSEEDQSWAYIRQAQLEVASSVPNTAMVVITDCGDRVDIHPRKKRPVGERLALAARAKVYGEDVEYSGPICNSVEVRGDKVILHFDHADQGLVSEKGELTGFELAGAGEVFHAAEAEITENMVVLKCKEVGCPVAVRYGWSNYPMGTLYNKSGLPASPFKKDII